MALPKSNTKNEYTFNFTGSVQQFEVPINGMYKLECWGAAGGIGNGNANPFGLGGYACGEILLQKGEILYIYVGEDGVDTNTKPSFNGGGAAYSNIGHNGGRGGGGSDIRKNGQSLNNRIIVAGGGGGAQASCGGINTTAGHGGGLIGGQSYNKSGGYAGAYANGGTQSSGGGGYNNNTMPVTKGSFGLGANSQTCGAGGGGGWYGGSSTYTAGGGGGSSYLGNLGNASTMSGVNTGHGLINITLITHHVSFVLCTNDKYYIPTKEFFDKDKNEFIPVTIDFLRDFENNYTKFIYDIRDLSKRIYLNNNNNFLPLEKFNIQDCRIIKIEYDDALIHDYMDFGDINMNYKYNSSNISFKYNTSNSVLILQGFANTNNYSKNFINIGKKSNIKVLIKNNDIYYGKELKKTTLDKILSDGIDGNELDSYNINFVNFDLCIAFKSKCYSEDDKLTKIEFHSREFHNMKRINDYELFHDTAKDKIYIKFNKDYNNILIKKLDNTMIDGEDSMGLF